MPRCAAGGADPARFGRAVEWATQVGVTLAGPSAELGIPAGTPVVAGGNDALASFHGAGLVDPGDAVDTGGTSGGLGVYWDRELDIPGTYRAPAGLPGLWLYGGAMNAIGKSVDWIARAAGARRAAMTSDALLRGGERRPRRARRAWCSCPISRGSGRPSTTTARAACSRACRSPTVGGT